MRKHLITVLDEHTGWYLPNFINYSSLYSYHNWYIYLPLFLINNVIILRIWLQKYTMVSSQLILNVDEQNKNKKVRLNKEKRLKHREKATWITVRPALPSSVMAVSHHLWMSGRTHSGPRCCKARGPGRSVPGHVSSLPRGRWVWWAGYCPGCTHSSVSPPIRQIDSDVVWSLRGKLEDELAKDQLPSLVLAILSLRCSTGCEICVWLKRLLGDNCLNMWWYKLAVLLFICQANVEGIFDMFLSGGKMFPM